MLFSLEGYLSFALFAEYPRLQYSQQELREGQKHYMVSLVS